MMNEPSSVPAFKSEYASVFLVLICYLWFDIVPHVGTQCNTEIIPKHIPYEPCVRSMQDNVTIWKTFCIAGPLWRESTRQRASNAFNAPFIVRHNKRFPANCEAMKPMWRQCNGYTASEYVLWSSNDYSDMILAEMIVYQATTKGNSANCMPKIYATRKPRWITRVHVLYHLRSHVIGVSQWEETVHM